MTVADLDPVLRPDAGNLLLVFDYTGRRAEAPVSALGLEDLGFDVRYLLAPPYPTAYTAADYAAQLLERHGPFEGVAAALAYCMAAPIAQEMLALWSATPPVPMIVFDGEPATPTAIESEYRLAERKLAGLLDLPLADAAGPAVVDEERLRRSPADLVDDMCRKLLEMGKRAAEAGTCDPEDAYADAAEVAAHYRNWFCHLVSAHGTTWPPLRGELVQLVSREHRLTHPWPGAEGSRTARLPAGRNDLLAHPDTRSAVLSLLGRGDDQ